MSKLAHIKQDKHLQIDNILNNQSTVIDVFYSIVPINNLYDKYRVSTNWRQPPVYKICL